jgi:hypothetical protein
LASMAVRKQPMAALMQVASMTACQFMPAADR